MTEKFDLYQTVTDQIVAQIEAGASGDKWEMPWHGFKGGRPFNAVSGRRYNGVNVLQLWNAGMSAGYPTHEWATFKQWLDNGTPVRKGERGTIVVYVGKWQPKADDNREPGEVSTRDRPRTFLRCTRAFNAAQVDGYESPALQERPALAQRLEAADHYVAAAGARIEYGLGRAFYSPHHDKIGMPDWDTFRDTATSTATEGAYSTLLHELTHWTGHESRCDRRLSVRFGDEAYAAEELIAELGAAFLCADLGIANAPRPDHAHYLASWLQVLKGDTKAIFTAATMATKACDYLDWCQAAGQAEAA